MPKNFGQKWKISSTFIRCPKLSGSIKFSKVSKSFGQQWFFSTLMILPCILKIPKTDLKFSRILRKNSPKSFQASSLFEGTKVLSKNETFPTYIICPKFAGRKKILKLPKKIQVSWKTFLKNSRECPKFLSSTGKKIPKFPQTAQTFLVGWENPLMWTVQQRVKITPSYYFIHVCLFLYFNHINPRIKEGLNGLKISLLSPVIFFFKFQMLHHWLASQEGFSIKWWQIFRTCLK